jgi:hypothetical protein
MGFRGFVRGRPIRAAQMVNLATAGGLYDDL